MFGAVFNAPCLWFVFMSAHLGIGRGAPLSESGPNTEGDPSPGSDTRLLHRVNPETVYELLDFENVTAEGDIILPTDRDAVHQIWPDYNGKVSIPFVIMPQLSKQYNDIMAALNMIRDSTCVTFHPRTNEADYINFQTGYGCASLVGFTGGVQPLYVGPSCTAGNICHELMHTLGFFHEHSRQDRENYINILYGNIIQGKESNFLLERGDSLGLPYDLSSILHYGSNFFSSNGQPTILPKSAGVSIGQRSHLSALDVAKVKRLYKCDERIKRARINQDS